MLKLGALFPGQGFQRFGILAPLAASAPEVVRGVVAECKGGLPDLDLERLLLGTGSEVDVTPTEIAQPLLLANSIAHFRAQPKEQSSAVVLGIGHSLGEYSALVAAGFLSLGDGLKLLRGRGLAMRHALDKSQTETGMMLVNNPRAGDWRAKVELVAKEAEVDVGSYNSPAAIVLSGEAAKLEHAVQLLKKQSTSRFVAKRLPVAGAFHSRFMKPAIPLLSELVEKANWQPVESAKFKVISNLTARPYTSIAEIKHACVASLTSPVQWCDSVRFAEPEVDEFRSYGGDIGALMAKFVKK